MTREEKLRAYSMWLDGVSVRRIAEGFDVSPQRIHQLLPNKSEKKQAPKRSYVYPNIARYLIENNIPLYEFAGKCNLSVTCLQAILSGRRGGCTKKTIDAILNVTGMTYEVAFAEEAPNEETV